MTVEPSNAETMKEFGYSVCRGPCHGEHLTFSLNNDGLCYWCAGTIHKETRSDKGES